MLESMDLVKRFDFGDNTARFELIVDDKDITTTDLQRMPYRGGIDECFDSNLESRIAKKHGFLKVIPTRVFGLCSSCQTT